MANYTLQTPPTLVFPSREKLESVITNITAAILSVDIVEIRPYYPQHNVEPSRQRTARACSPCHRRHARCHGRSENISCSKANCTCVYHQAAMMEEDIPSPTGFNYFEEAPSTTGIRRPGLLCTRHFAGETSFCPYIPKCNQPRLLVPELPITVPISYPRPPSLSQKEQHDLIDVYYENMSPYFPFINKFILYNQLSLFMQNQPCYLSPLFFYALFSRAAHIIGDQRTQDGRLFEHVGEQFMEYALVLRSCYQTQSSISTVLALVIMANQLEQTKRYKLITKSWILAGEAFRMVVDIGMHRMGNLNEFETEDQLCIRAFWLAYITDATISLSYGRPSAVEEKILDVVTPRTLDTDDVIIKYWVQALSDILSLSKISVRIVRFNYSPPPVFQLEGPIKRHNAFLASMDSWLTDLRYPLNEDETENSGQLAEIKQRLQFQKEIFFLTDLILLHRPYIEDTINDRSHPSLDICSYAATAIIYHSYKLGEAGISYHAILPMLAYSLVIALRIQIMNAAHNTNASKYNSSKVCELGLHILAKLPQTKSAESILSDALEDLRKHFYNRQAPSVYEDEVVYIAQRVPTQLRPADHFIFGGPAPNSPEPGPSNGGTNNDLTMIHYPAPRQVGQRTAPRGGVNRVNRNRNTHRGMHYGRSVTQRRGTRRDSTSPRAQQQRPTNPTPPRSDISSQQNHDVSQEFIQILNTDPIGLQDPNIDLLDPLNRYLTEEDIAFLQNLPSPSHYYQDVDSLTFDMQNATMNDSFLQQQYLNTPFIAAPFPAVLSWFFETPQAFIDHEQEREMHFQQSDFLPSPSPSSSPPGQ